MKLETHVVRFGWNNKNVLAWPFLFSLFSLLNLNTGARAEEVITSSLSSPTQTISQQSEPSEFQVFAPVPFSSQDQPFQWGPVVARPHVSYQYLHGSGIQSTPTNQYTTDIHEVSPGITIDLGTHWALDYTPTLRYYSDNHFKDEFNNAVSLTGNNAYQDWVFGLSQSYESSSSPLVETATQTDREIFLTALSASYAINEKMSLDMDLYQNLLFAANFQSFRDWSTMDWFNYQFWPRFNVGIGAGLGYVNVDAGPDQTYEHLSGRINWRATDKLSFQVNAGFEERQFLGGGAGSLFNPTFGAAIQYQPFEANRISLNANRSVSSSYFQDQVTENTSVSCNLNQRLLGKFYLDLSAGYGVTKYVGSTTSTTVDREDDSPNFSARLSRSILKRGTVSVFYTYSKTSSTAPGYSFNSNQVGFSVRYSY